MKIKFPSIQKQPMIRNSRAGFTLIEMIVSTSIFIIAMVIIIGALISLENASRKARAIRVATDNLSAAIDSMSRNIRMGTYIHCGAGGVLTLPQDCAMTDSLGAGGDTFLAFESQMGNPLLASDQYVYRLTGGHIERSTDGGVTYLNLTAPEINITDLRFYVTGTETNNNQPYVTMLVRGVVSAGTKSSTEFDIQTTIGVRTPNFSL